MADERTPSAPVPESRTVPKRKTRLSLVWIIPILAAVVGVWVAVTRILSAGPEITIMMQSASGLEAGTTKINYRGVAVGTVSKIRLSEDHHHVIVIAQMAPRTEGFLVEGTQFWVVRPRISGANVTGLGTLISGSFIGMEIGDSKVPKRDFVALETEPVVSGQIGRFFVLKTPDLGSLDAGTPVFFRHLQVGQVASYKLDPDGQSFSLRVFVKAPYDRFVSPNTRFWQSSGINVQLTAAGLNVETQSLLSILIGGVAFETPRGPMLPPSAANDVFTLFANRTDAFAPAAHNPQTYELIFNESVRGLEVGAPVEFRGIQIGEVAAVRAQIDLQTFKFSVPVTIQLDPERLGISLLKTRAGMNLASVRRRLIDSLVSHGVRAQLQTGSLLTGSTFVELDVFPDAPPATVDWSRTPVRLPTVPGQLEATEKSVNEIIRKVDRMPLEQIGNELQKTLTDLDRTVVTARGTLETAQGTLTTANGTLESAHSTLDNANNVVEPGSVQTQELDNALHEITRAARSVRVLSDYLERHPEALIRGKAGEAK